MPRHVSLPGADELFRPTKQKTSNPADPVRSVGEETSVGSSGRVKHDEKITVYLSSGELVRLETLRLKLRADHGLAVDRGRIVRAAIDIALDSFDSTQTESELFNRLADQ